MVLVVKNLPANAEDARDACSIPELERSTGEGHGNPLQYSCLKNPMDRGAWQAVIHRVAESQTQLKWLSTHACQYLKTRMRRISFPFGIVNDSQVHFKGDSSHRVFMGRIIGLGWCPSSESGIGQCSSVRSLSHVWLCDPMDCSTPDLSVHHQLPGFIQTHVHWVGDAIQPSHPLTSPSPPAFNLSQHQGLFTWASSSHQVAKVLEFQLQHQSFNEYSGLISFRMNGWISLLSKGLSRVFSSTTVQKHQFFGAQLSL